MSFNDYVKFVTQQFVTYVDQPKEKRKEMRQERKASREPAGYRLFGLVPMALAMSIKKIRKKTND